jgi:hypothetical protein
MDHHDRMAGQSAGFVDEGMPAVNKTQLSVP